MRSFASGCTAMTGVEAVSNAVPLFRGPEVRRAQRTLVFIVVALIALLIGVAMMSRLYGIEATAPNSPGYRSVLSQVVETVGGRGFFYYVTMGSIVVVLCLSANTSYADFPRVCRLLALEQFLPLSFAHRGRRLVFGRGIVFLALAAIAILVAFGGVTDRLIPLFAIGAFIAFTMSQLGMVFHWRRRRDDAGARRALVLNAGGAAATASTLLIIIIAKFSSGAWLTLLMIALLVWLFATVRRRQATVLRETETGAPLRFDHLTPPIIVVPIRDLGQVARRGLALAVTLSPEVHAVQVITEEPDEPDLRAVWPTLVEPPLVAEGRRSPRLTVIRSPYRELFDPLLAWIGELTKANPGRDVIVLIPELVERPWWHAIFGTHRATIIRDLLILRGGPQVSVMSAPWYEWVLAAELTPPRRAAEKPRSSRQSPVP